MADTEKLSWDEIRKRYPDEWVVLTESSFNENDDIVDGVVYDHGADRAQLYARCQDGPDHTTVLYTGELRGGIIGFYADDLDQKD